MGIIKKWLRLETLPVVLFRLFFILCGIAVILMRGTLMDNIHFVVGAAIILVSAGILTKSIRTQSYRQEGNVYLPTSVVGIVLGIMVLVRREDSIPFIAIAWGINGLECGIVQLNHAIRAKLHREPYVFKLIHGTLETLLALALIFNPYHSLGKHIVILGLEMIIQAFTGKDEFVHHHH